MIYKVPVIKWWALCPAANDSDAFDIHMRAIAQKWVYEEYNYTVVIFSDKDTNQESPLEFVDTYTEMAARTVLDAVNLGIINDWRQLYG